MIDRNTFIAFDDETKFTLYNEHANMILFLQGVIKDLLPSKDKTTVPIQESVVLSTIPAAASSQPPVPNTVSTNLPPPGLRGENVSNFPYHLSLPKDLQPNGLIVGDSISKRIEADQVADKIIVRGYGGAKTTDILSRIKNTRPKQIDTVYVSVGLNDCMSREFDAQVSTEAIQNIIYTVNHKFQPKNIAISLLTPLCFQRRECNNNVIALNSGISELANKITDLQGAKLSIVNMYNTFTSSGVPAISTDGVHQSIHGHKLLIQSIRTFFGNFIQTSSSDISIREPPARGPSN